MTPTPAALLTLAVAAARQAGAFLLAGRGAVRSVSTKSSATDMVSEMDQGAERLIRHVILAERPGDAILGEEEGEWAGAGPATGVRWIVDPLDGTTNYLYGLPAWCVSVAAEIHGVVVAGAVFDAVHDELWTATLGGGGARNGLGLPPLAGGGELATALVATGFSYDAGRRGPQGLVAAHVVARIRDLRRAGAAALDLCWVAGGRLDAYYEEGTRPWDRAAGALIATEVGAVVTGFEGGAATDAGVLAARPGLASALQTLLAEARARSRT
ncbi:MAG: inositol monophosphatase family protein [Acidimicrobiales bacterium]